MSVCLALTPAKRPPMTLPSAFIIRISAVGRHGRGTASGVALSTRTSRWDKPPRLPTQEDEYQAAMHAAARAAAVDRIKALLDADRNRLLRSLQPHEVDGIVNAAVCAWALMRDQICAKELEEIGQIAIDIFG